MHGFGRMEPYARSVVIGRFYATWWIDRVGFGLRRFEQFLVFDARWFTIMWEANHA